MSREWLFPFLPAALAAVTDVLTAGIVVAHQPDYPGGVVVYQVLMFGGSPGGSSNQVGAVRGFRNAVVRDSHHLRCQSGCSIFQRSLRLCG
jgi:hypothetical protein